jgi:formylmethanofuran dehydrogenase subunit E
MDKIRDFTFEEYCDRIRDFHGGLAPGVIIAGFMVDLAYQHLPADSLFDVICETTACLPDAVQLLTPCTVGNQWMHIIDVGRYALTVYDKHTGEGVRVYIDAAKLDRWPVIQEWFLKIKSKKEQDRQHLTDQVREAGTDIFSVAKIKVSPDFIKKQSKSVAICPVCREAFKAESGPVCPACKEHNLPYKLSEKT